MVYVKRFLQTNDLGIESLQIFGYLEDTLPPIFDKPSIHVKRDNSVSVQYAEELNSITISATHQSTDRRHGIVGQKSSHFQRDS